MAEEDIGQEVLVKGDTCVIHTEDDEQNIAQNNRQYNWGCVQKTKNCAWQILRYHSELLACREQTESFTTFITDL